MRVMLLWQPAKFSMLLSRQTPALGGGDTHFSDMVLPASAACQWPIDTMQVDALATLPADVRQLVNGLSIKHDASHNSAGTRRQGYEEQKDPRLVSWR